MKNGRPTEVKATAGRDAGIVARQGRFEGTDNPRHLRAIAALMTRARPREALDREAGCSNGPALVAELRARGLAIPCDRVPVIDRDGREVRRGVYNLTDSDRRRVNAWLRTRRPA